MENTEYLSLEIGTHPSVTIFRVLHDIFVPRPVMLISTVDQAGILNLAPFSYINATSTHPPCIMVSLLRKEDGGEKDTLVNIKSSGEFVVNCVTESMIERANQCGHAAPPDHNEFEMAGFIPASSTLVRPPRVAESPVQMECVTYSMSPIGDGSAGSATVIIGEIKMMHIRKDIHCGEGQLDLDLLRLVGRSSVDGYLVADNFFKLPRPVTGDVGFIHQTS